MIKWDQAIMPVIHSRLHPDGNFMKDIKHAFADIIKNYDVWIAYREHVFKTLPEVVGPRDI